MSVEGQGPTEQDLIDTINGTNTAPAVEAAPAAPAEPESQQQQPNTQEPAKADPAQPAAAPVTNNFDEELGKISGGALKSKEDIAKLIEGSTKLTEFETRVKQYEEENTSLKAKVNTDPFASPFLKGLNDLYKSNASETQIAAYTTLNRVNLEELQPLEQRKLALQMQHGLTPQEAEEHLNGLYKLNPDEYDDAEIAKAKIALKIDAKTDLTYLNTQKAESAIAPGVKEDTEAKAQAQAHIEKLQPIAQNIMNELSFKGLSINGKQGQDALVTDFEISDNSRKELAAQMEGYISNYGNNIPATEEGIQQMKQFAENVLVLNNWKNWLINAASVRETQVRAEYNNPSGINRGNDNPNKGKTSQEELGNWLLENAQY